MNLHRTLLVFQRLTDTAGEGSLGWFRPVGNVMETPLPSVNQKGQAEFHQASSHVLGNTPTLGGKPGRKPEGSGG